MKFARPPKSREAAVSMRVVAATHSYPFRGFLYRAEKSSSPGLAMSPAERATRRSNRGDIIIPGKPIAGGDSETAGERRNPPDDINFRRERRPPPRSGWRRRRAASIAASRNINPANERNRPIADMTSL